MNNSRFGGDAIHLKADQPALPSVDPALVRMADDNPVLFFDD